jgi:hypothetical protein
MKTKIKSSAIVGICLLACVVSLPACAQIKSWVTKPGIVEVLKPAQTNLVDVVTTNATESAAITNTDGTIIPPHTVFTLTTNVTPIISPAITFTNLELSPLVQTGITSADTAASAAGIPWAHTVATGILGLLALFLSYTNTSAKRKLQDEITSHTETASALTITEDVAKTLVQNFEQLRQVALTIPGYTRDIDDKVMTAIQTVQEIAGVKSHVNDLVDANTNTTIPGSGAVVTTSAVK